MGNIIGVSWGYFTCIFKYLGDNNNIPAGSGNDYETDTNGIYHALRRIARSDCKRDKDLDYAKRLEFLKNAVFRD